ncbi:hypothetical protein [Amycolatopsis saalfeldensis]|uniref:Uncharacterized protein n=1 Tax=Amycolatopsis saalfeldensis TaxID=394193 RepID=A0A1H8YJV2_9PSEU|nr:hypothetical protein [Amycolatopsis saalfeldensis]SEP52445.1 hypothetical protein SAMN04489732_120108 [Amycolatopsis saalfeldensis]
MSDPLYVAKIVDAYRKTAAALGSIADRFDSHASVIATMDEGLGSVARGYAIDLFALKRRLEGVCNDLMWITQKREALGKKRR